MTFNLPSGFRVEELYVDNLRWHRAILILWFLCAQISLNSLCSFFHQDLMLFPCLELMNIYQGTLSEYPLQCTNILICLIGLLTKVKKARECMCKVFTVLKRSLLNNNSRTLYFSCLDLKFELLHFPCSPTCYLHPFLACHISQLRDEKTLLFFTMVGIILDFLWPFSHFWNTSHCAMRYSEVKEKDGVIRKSCDLR